MWSETVRRTKSRSIVHIHLPSKWRAAYDIRIVLIETHFPNVQIKEIQSIWLQCWIRIELHHFELDNNIMLCFVEFQGVFQAHFITNVAMQSK